MLPQSARVFVTGGTGLVGSHVATQLVCLGNPVRALHRADSDVTYVAGLGCELVVGDTRDEIETLAAAMAGCDAVVHTAAVTYVKLPWEKVREINVGGTERVMRAAARAGVKSVVHVSSVAVHGGRPGRSDESSPTDAPLLPRELYARSKREAEAVVHATARELGLSATILRPAAVYGERDRLFTPTVVRTLRLPVQFLLGDGHGTIAAVYAGNVADAVVTALGATAPSPGARAQGARIFDFGADNPLDQRQLYTALTRALEVPFRPAPLPGAMVLAAARIADAIGLRIPGAHELPLPRTVRLAIGPNPYGSEKIRAELGWSPPFSLDESLERTARWVARERRSFGI